VEEWGAWAVGESSEFGVRFPSKQPVTVTVSAFPYFVAGRRQSVEIYYNGTVVGHYDFPENAPDLQQFSFAVPRSLVTGALDVIKFVYGYALSPQELGNSNDGRPLAIGMVELRMTQ
jgi:hypothetical protein